MRFILNTQRLKKNIFKGIFGIFISMLISATSCDKVSEPFIDGGGNVVSGDTVRKLLFEDFTGHECVNCPAAHLIIEDLQGFYSDRIIVMAEHVGFFAKPKLPPFDYDFRTTAGDDIATAFGAISAPLPKGMINRKKQNGDYLLDRAAFATGVSLVLDSLPLLPDVYIEILPSYNSTDSTIKVDIKLSVLSNLPYGRYNLAVMITEDGIIKPQKNNDDFAGDVPEILDYKHNNVLRGAINTTWGEVFATAGLTAGQVFTKSYVDYKIGKDWNPANLKIIAFVYYADGPNNKIVIQAQEAKL